MIDLDAIRGRCDALPDEVHDVLQGLAGLYLVHPHHTDLSNAMVLITNLRIALNDIPALLGAIDRLVKALEEIKLATVEGRVCDDVAWFNTITTLHDYCDAQLAAIARKGEQP